MVPEPEPPDTHLESRSTSEIEALELYRRSPHPYHRQKHELRSLAEASASSSNDFLSLRLRPPGQAVFDEDGRTRGKLSQSPSDSGTEADDEGYGFIKALPAPPLRPHKGLRVARGTIGDATPLLTPSQVDEEGRKVSEYFKPRREGTRSADSSPTDAEARVAREKYLRRRRNEVIRRTTETVLLAAISVLAVTGCSCWEKLLLWHRGWSTRQTLALANTKRVTSRPTHSRPRYGRHTGPLSPTASVLLLEKAAPFKSAAPPTDTHPCRL